MTKRNEELVEFPRQSARDILTDVLRAGLSLQSVASALQSTKKWANRNMRLTPVFIGRDDWI